MAAGKSIYEKLSEKIGVVGYPRYIEILENQVKPEEAELAVDIADGKTKEELQKKLKIDEKTLNAQIDDLAKKRYIQRGKDGRFSIPQMPRFFPRTNDTPKLKQLWFDFFHSGDYEEIDITHMKARAKIRGIRSHKIIPAKQALLASPNISKDHILWYEDMEQIFKHSQAISQGGFNKENGTLGTKEGCGCRRFWGTCDSPGGCTGWSWRVGEWGQENPVGLSFGGRGQVTFEQAMDSCYKMEDYGLIHLSPNTAQITSTCNCCECCCEIIHGMKKRGIIWEMLAPSRFKAVIDTEKCQGCQTCVERCHFDAVEMKKVPGSKKMKAFIIDEHCMGCGLCIYKCPNKAMRFEIVRPPAHIPTITMNQFFGR